MLSELKVGAIGLLAGLLSSTASIGVWKGTVDANQANTNQTVNRIYSRMEDDSKYIRGEFKEIRQQIADLRVESKVVRTEVEGENHGENG